MWMEEGREGGRNGGALLFYHGVNVLSKKPIFLNWDPGGGGWKNTSRKFPFGVRSTAQTLGI